MTTKEMIAIMMAYEDGKTIQYNFKGDDPERWEDVTCVPLWNWDSTDYRVKPEVKYVPYDNVSEVNKNKWFKGKTSGVLKRISALDPKDNSVYILGWFNLNQLFELFTYEDGTPCGKQVEE